MAHFEKFQAGALGNMCAHYDRTPEIERGYARSNIDPERTHLNYNLGPDHGELSQVDFIASRIASLDLKRAPRKDAVRMADCIVTLPQGYKGDARGFFEAVRDALDGMFGKANCVSAFVHLDESQPHMHYAFVPVTEDGRLSAKSLLDRNFMKSFHGNLEREVASRLGVGRAGITLTDEQREGRAGRYVELPELRAASARAEKLEAACRETEARLESLRQKEVGLEEEVAEFKAQLGEVGAARRNALDRVGNLEKAVGEVKELVARMIAAARSALRSASLAGESFHHFMAEFGRRARTVERAEPAPQTLDAILGEIGDKGRYDGPIDNNEKGNSAWQR